MDKIRGVKSEIGQKLALIKTIKLNKEMLGQTAYKPINDCSYSTIGTSLN
jgi:hypothetical protein